MSLMPVTVLLLTLAPFALKWDVPAGWVSQKPATSMRVAEFALPKAAGDAEDGQLAVFFFGGQGGSVQANLDRWISQMTQPDGKASKDVAKTSKLTTKSGLAVTLVDLSGTYVAEVSPGSAERFNKPGFRLRAAVVETPEGPYFVKLTGPAKTIGRWESAFSEFLSSIRAGLP
jgi:hypothetical protein